METPERRRAAAYFASLPALVQESIRQSDLHFSTEAELRAFVARLGG